MTMSYEEALAFISAKSQFGINLGLQRIEELLRRLGNPHQTGNVKYVHIAGTNGKGSTASFVQHILAAAGYRVGFFSSPHLYSYQERIRINEQNIPQEDVVALVEELAPHLEGMAQDGFETPTEFEINTVMALLYFDRQQVDWAVIETGLGGAIDSTNVILPEVAVITNVAMDHMDYLGNTIAEIATVKAGIIKDHVPVVTGIQDPIALEVVQKKVAETGSSLMVLGRDFQVRFQGEDSLRSQRFCYQDQEMLLNGLRIAMLGGYQLQNAALAIACAQLLKITPEAIRRGLQQTTWPGRLEILSTQPLIVLDGAHNVHGMTALAQAVDHYWQGSKIVALFGMLADKEREKALAKILPYIDSAVITKVNSPRAGNWAYLAEVCRQVGVLAELVEDNEAAALRVLALAAERQADVILITGSLYMLGEVRHFLLEKLTTTTKQPTTGEAE